MSKARVAKARRRAAQTTRAVKSSARTDNLDILKSDLLIFLLLALAIFLIYSRVLHFDFVTFDDPDYVTANPHVQAGLTLAGVAWAFSSGFAGNWFPLTWLSHMLDWQLFGADSGWHHFTNVCIHVATALLLFALLKRMTRARWRSALVAFLFALHPLHVESVAWVSERKDVLSGLFWVLTLLSYTAYAARPTRTRYALTLLLFCLGLMTKSMLVTLPLVLLLLDYWPLRRGIKILEKIPFFVASIASAIVTYFVHKEAGATASFELIPTAVRFENALVSYVVYILKMFWPAHLAMFYPYPWQPIVVEAVVAGIILIIVTAIVIRLFPRYPYLTVGWFWYLITLLPVVGLIQVGAQARADRYTYIPMIGLAILFVWGGSQALERLPHLRTALAIAVCSACLALTWVQLGYWRDSLSLYRHAISAVPDSYLARFNLATVLDSRGETTEAIAQLREVTRTRPRLALAHAELGQLLAKQNQPQQALDELQTAVRLRPDLADPHFRLGSVLGALGRSNDAAAEFSNAVRLQPENADAHYNLAIALAQQGKLREALPEFSATVRLAPDDVAARVDMGIALAKLGRLDDAIFQLSEAVRLKPDFAEARQALTDLNNTKNPAKQ